MSSVKRISRVTSDAFNREHNTLVTANALGKIFTGKEVSNLDLNLAITAGIYRFDNRHQHAPVDVDSGYVQVTTINPDHSGDSNGVVRIRQIVYPDDVTTAYTRVGNAESSLTTIRWSDWAELGSGGMFSAFQELTRDQMAAPKTMYRSFNTFVLTLPDVNGFTEGTYFGLEQYDALGIVIDTNGTSVVNGRLIYDPISDLLFELVVTGSETYWTLSNQEVTDEIRADQSLRPTAEKIEYVEPQMDNGITTCTKFVACVTRDRNSNLVWVVDSENAVATVIKSLLSAFTEIRNDIYKYVDANDTPYRLFRMLHDVNVIGKSATFYRSFGTNVVTLPDPTEDVEGRWIGIEQQSGSTYVVDSHAYDNEPSSIIYDPATEQVFELTVTVDSYRWVLVAPENYPADVTTNEVYRDSRVKIRAVTAATDSITLREFYLSRDFSGNQVWVATNPVTCEIL